MKINKLLLSLAICGASTVGVSAQTVQLTAGTPTTPIILAAQDGLSFGDEVPEVEPSFEFDDLAAPLTVAPVPDKFASPSDQMGPSISENNNQSIAPEPQSLPVSIGQDHQSGGYSHVAPSMAGISHVNDGPVMWGNAPHRRSGVAQILLRTECNAQALWANYPAERAQECADMWKCLNKNRGAGCGCNECASPRTTLASRCNLNRYLTKPLASKCDSCVGLVKSLAGGSKVRTVATPVSPSQPIAAAPGPQIHSLPPPPPTRPVAKPQYNTASTAYRIMY